MASEVAEAGNSCGHEFPLGAALQLGIENCSGDRGCGKPNRCLAPAARHAVPGRPSGGAQGRGTVGVKHTGLLAMHVAARSEQLVASRQAV